MLSFSPTWGGDLWDMGYGIWYMDIGRSLSHSVLGVPIINPLNFRFADSDKRRPTSLVCASVDIYTIYLDIFLFRMCVCVFFNDIS